MGAYGDFVLERFDDRWSPVAIEGLSGDVSRKDGSTFRSTIIAGPRSSHPVYQLFRDHGPFAVQPAMPSDVHPDHIAWCTPLKNAGVGIRCLPLTLLDLSSWSTTEVLVEARVPVERAAELGNGRRHEPPLGRSLCRQPVLAEAAHDYEGAERHRLHQQTYDGCLPCTWLERLTVFAKPLWVAGFERLAGLDPAKHRLLLGIS